MKMTFNWGTGIFLFYTVFASVLFFSVYQSTQHDHSLVVDNYYEHDLAYQDHINKLENSAALATKVNIQWEKEKKQVNIVFPKELTNALSGTVRFYRPNNKKLDWQLPINVDLNNTMPIDISQMPLGRWKVQVDWNNNNLSYFDTQILDIR